MNASSDIYDFLTSNSNLSILKEYAQHDNQEYRRCIAINPYLDGDTFRILMNDECDYVRGALATNPSCPSDVIEHLSEDAIPWVFEWLAGNPSITEQIAERIITRSKQFEINDGASWFTDAEYHLASNPKCPISYLAEWIQSDCPVMMLYLCRNPKLPIHLIEQYAYLVHFDELFQHADIERYQEIEQIYKTYMPLFQ